MNISIETGALFALASEPASMSEIAGWRWTVVVFGPVALLFGVVGLAYAGLFVVPSAPCGGAETVEPPTAEFAISTNGSTVTATYVGNETVGGPTTDRVVVSVRNAASPDTASREWIDGDDTISRGDSIAIPPGEIEFQLSARDRVTVQWYGSSPDQPDFCPSDNRYAELTAVRLENASTF
ncbi:hypothetical protein [Halapricum hydrolyticum]|uniref:Uncharacterized protein n=1 Tax=Halapricum hydrolyticum TaxID=2979991 RepID=A0AAE3IDE2_9EURY|nr:hypothetical protein [Halapricum hydrolyticum]MCU4719641.1 hypothetical protein [Halapricum hydrolyticum]MCU4728563.1 hypothetical protein [Halapricum hydrolyticum]